MASCYQVAKCCGTICSDCSDKSKILTLCSFSSWALLIRRKFSHLSEKYRIPENRCHRLSENRKNRLRININIMNKAEKIYKRKFLKLKTPIVWGQRDQFDFFKLVISQYFKKNHYFFLTRGSSIFKMWLSNKII